HFTVADQPLIGVDHHHRAVEHRDGLAAGPVVPPLFQWQIDPIGLDARDLHPRESFMLILNAAEVRAALPMPDAIAAMKAAFAALSSGHAIVPPRARLPIEPHSGISLIMPSYVHAPETEALAVKVVSLFDGNRLRGLARIQASVLVLDPATGRLEALLE